MITQLYVGNLSWSVTDSDLQDFMQAAGAVKSAQVVRYPDGRSKGWGLVEFADPAGASQAMGSLSDMDLMGRKVFIREDREREGGEGGGGGAAHAGGNARSRSGRGRSRARPPLENPAEEPTSGTALFVGNLPWSTTSGQLREVFSEYNVKTAEVKAGYDGRSRGYGVVSFESEEDAAAALALQGYNIDGREMLVRFDRQLGQEE